MMVKGQRSMVEGQWSVDGHLAYSSVILLAVVAFAHAQRPLPTFHAEIDYVEFPVRVTLWKESLSEIDGEVCSVR